MKKGYGAPTTSTIGEIGEKYLDLSTGEVYECTAVVPAERDMGFVSTYELYSGQFTWVKAAGGDCDWNIMKNKPFGEETVVSAVTVVEETEFVLGSGFELIQSNPNGNGYISVPTPGYFRFESGKKYRVTINDISYTGVAEDTNKYGVMANGTAVPLVDENGKSHGNFATAMGAGYSDYFFYDAGLDEGSTLTLTIEELSEEEVITSIDPKYLPEALQFGEETSVTTIFSGDVEMVGQDVGGVYFTSAYVPTGLSVLPEEVTITVNGESTVVKIDEGSFTYNGQSVSVGRSKDDNGDWTVLQFRHGGNSNYTIEGVTVTAASTVITPIDPKFIVLTSPNGTKYNLSVADDGTLSAVAAT